MTGILEKPTTNNSRSNVHYLFSVRNMFFSNFGGWPDLKPAVAAFDFSNLYASVILTHLPLALGSQTMASKTDEFRSNADECRRRAEGATKSFDKEHWLRMAEHWSKMAAAEEAAAAHS
jgi:hypothetical protein